MKIAVGVFLFFFLGQEEAMNAKRAAPATIAILAVGGLAAMAAEGESPHDLARRALPTDGAKGESRWPR